MKKIIILCMVLSISALTACNKGILEDESQSLKETTNSPVDKKEPAQPPVIKSQAIVKSDDVVFIKEKLFVAQINDIYLNQEDYIGKVIKYEGMFSQYYWEETDKTYYLVYRNSPGCCGADGQAGFEVVWPDGIYEKYPEFNDWVEVTGTLERYTESEGNSFLHIVIDSMTVLKERGAEYVSQ